MNLEFRSSKNPRTAAMLNEMAKRLNVSGVGVDAGPMGTVIRKRRAYMQLPFPFGSDHPWGLVSVSGASVTIASGEFSAGNGAYLATPQTTFTITDDGSYIGLRYDPASGGSLSLIGPTTTRPTPGSGLFDFWLYYFAFDGVRARYVKHNLTGAHAGLYAASAT